MLLCSASPPQYSVSFKPFIHAYEMVSIIANTKIKMVNTNRKGYWNTSQNFIWNALPTAPIIPKTISATPNPSAKATRRSLNERLLASSKWSKVTWSWNHEPIQIETMPAAIIRKFITVELAVMCFSFK